MGKERRPTIADVNRKLDIIMGVLVNPANVQALHDGKSLDEALRKDACRRSHETGDMGYIKDYLSAKNKARTVG